MDYRIRWQQQRRQRQRRRLLIIPAALLLAGLLYLLLRDVGGGSQVLWVHRGPQRLTPHFTATESFVYVAWPDGHIHVLRASDGESITPGPFFSVPEAFNVAPTLASRVLYLGSDLGNLRAIHAGTGQLQWQHDTQAPIRAQPLAYQGRIYPGNEDGKVYCFTADGRKLWVARLGDPVSGQPAVVGRTLVVATTSGPVHGLDFMTGRTVWRNDLEAPLFAAVTAAPPLALVGSDNGYLYVLDGSTGQLVKSYYSRGLVRTPPAADDNVIAFASTDGWLRVISRDGMRPLWAFELPGPVAAGPVASGGVLYVASARRLFALEARSGRVLESWRGEQFAGELVVFSGTVYIGTLDGVIMALAAPASHHGSDN